MERTAREKLQKQARSAPDLSLCNDEMKSEERLPLQGPQVMANFRFSP